MSVEDIALVATESVFISPDDVLRTDSKFLYLGTSTPTLLPQIYFISPRGGPLPADPALISLGQLDLVTTKGLFRSGFYYVYEIPIDLFEVRGFWQVVWDEGLTASFYATSEPPGPVVPIPPELLPINTIPPVISGAFLLGVTLSVTTGTWLNHPFAFSYQWLRNSVPIVGATANTYVVVSADLGQLLSVVVTATNELGIGRVTVYLGSVSSAGIFTVPNDQLVRTLWAASTNDLRLANPAASWDGTDDLGFPLPAGTYNLKLLQHGIQYNLDGYIGNTSPNHTHNLFYHSGTGPPNALCITNAGEIYFSMQYSEKFPVACYTTTADPQTINYIGTGSGVVGSANFTSLGSVCTDNVNVYWLFAPINFGSNGIFATKISDKSQVIYTNNHPGGIFTPYGAGCASAFGVTTDFCTGLAVQQSGNYLFGTYNVTGNIITYNKTTGAILHTVTPLAHAARCVLNPTNDNELWVDYTVGGSFIDAIAKCSVDGAGNVTVTSTRITGLANHLGMTISPDGSTLILMDGTGVYNAQQIKAFNTSNGSVKTAWGNNGTFGDLGGYANGPAVSQHRFSFESGFWTFSGSPGAIAYVPADGSFWVADGGNARVQHFSAGNSPTYIEQMAWMPGFYSVNVARNEPSPSAFAQHLEFAIDYTKPLSPTNGSWKLLNNWGQLFQFLTDGFTCFQYVGTYSNGRRYCTLNAGSGREIFEMLPTGLRDTGQTYAGSLTGAATYLESNTMNRKAQSYNLSPTFPNPPTAQVLLYEEPMLGFDSNNNPVFGTASALTSQTVNLSGEFIPGISSFPVPNTINSFVVPTDTLANGAMPVFSPGAFYIPPNNYPRLGGLNLSDGSVKFTCYPVAPITNGGFVAGFNSFSLRFCDPPFFPSGCGSNNSGGSIQYIPGDTHFFTGFRGEQYMGGQANEWSHWHQSGLLLNRFGAGGAPLLEGTSAEQFPRGHLRVDVNTMLPNAPGIPNWVQLHKGNPKLTGNSAWGGIALVNGVYYIYHGDEWYNASIMRWSISGVNTIQISQQSVTYNGAPTFTNDFTDPLKYLPTGIFNPSASSGGWTLSPPPTSQPPITLPWWRIYTNGIVADIHLSPDIVVEFVAAGAVEGNYTAYANLTPGGGSWSITGTLYACQISTKSGLPGIDDYQLFFQVLDNTGKRIIRILIWQAGLADAGMDVNDVTITPGFPVIGPESTSQDWVSYVAYPQPFSISYNSGTGLMSVSYGNNTPVASAVGPYTTSGVGVYDVGANGANPTKFGFSGIAGAGTTGGPAVTAISGVKMTGMTINYTPAANPSLFTNAQTFFVPTIDLGQAASWKDNVVNNGGTVSAGRLTLVNNLITGLVSDGVWSKLDRLWLHAGENQPSALTDLVAFALAQTTNSPTFTIDRGYTGNGTGYINTFFAPGTNGKNCVSGSASMGIWARTVGGEASVKVLGGTSDTGPANSEFSIFNRPDLPAWEYVFPAAPFTLLFSAANTAGFISMSQISTAITAYINGSSVATGTSTVNALPATNMFVLAENSPFGTFPTTSQVTASFWGGGLTATDMSNLYTRLQIYMTAIGA
jgi:hypothetical protein